MGIFWLILIYLIFLALVVWDLVTNGFYLIPSNWVHVSYFRTENTDSSGSLVTREKPGLLEVLFTHYMRCMRDRCSWQSRLSDPSSSVCISTYLGFQDPERRQQALEKGLSPLSKEAGGCCFMWRQHGVLMVIFHLTKQVSTFSPPLTPSLACKSHSLSVQYNFLWWWKRSIMHMAKEHLKRGSCS